MPRLLTSLGILLALVAGAAPARGDGPRDDLRRRPDGTVPLLADNLDRAHAQAVALELLFSAGHGESTTEVRAAAAHFVLPLSRAPRAHDHLLSLGLDMLSWEASRLRTDDNGTFHFLGASLRLDGPLAGAYAGLDLLTISDDTGVTFLSPIAGVRVGDPMVAEVVLTVRLAGGYLASLGGPPADLAHNYDIDLLATTPLSSAFHLQARARLRDRQGERERLSDLFAALGVEWGLSRADGDGRALPVFLGIGLRDVISAQHAHVSEGRWVLSDPGERGLALLLVLDVDLGMHGRSSVW